MKRILTLLIALQATDIGQPCVAAGNDLENQSRQCVACARAETINPFAGVYCGYLDSRNYGSLSISESGNVSGNFSYFFPTFSESYKLSGRVNPDGAMRLKVVHTITVRDRRRGTSTERYSVTVFVALDESGNLAATSGAAFVLSPCS